MPPYFVPDWAKAAWNRAGTGGIAVGHFDTLETVQVPSAASRVAFRAETRISQLSVVRSTLGEHDPGALSNFLLRVTRHNRHLSALIVTLGRVDTTPVCKGLEDNMPNIEIVLRVLLLEPRKPFFACGPRAEHQGESPVPRSVWEGSSRAHSTVRHLVWGLRFDALLWAECLCWSKTLDLRLLISSTVMYHVVTPVCVALSFVSWSFVDGGCLWGSVGVRNVCSAAVPLPLWCPRPGWRQCGRKEPQVSCSNIIVLGDTTTPTDGPPPPPLAKNGLGGL